MPIFLGTRQDNISLPTTIYDSLKYDQTIVI